MNVSTFAGRIGGDPRLASVNGQQGAVSVLNFSLAVTKRQKGQDGKPLTLWVDCSLWGTRADALAQYIKKGGYVTVTGEADVEMFQGANGAGVKMTLRCNDVSLQGSAGQATGQAPAAQSHQPQQQPQIGYRNGAATPNNYNPTPQQNTAIRNGVAEPLIDFDDDIPF
jgi:single-strand DNA-binding protein